MPKGPALLIFINEIVIAAMEAIGMILVAFGLGVFASWIAGLAGFLVVSGGGLVGAAYLAAREQKRQTDEMQANLPPPEPKPGLINTVQTAFRYKQERQLDSIRDGEPLSS